MKGAFMEKRTDIKSGMTLPMIPTRDLVVFPGMSVNFDVGREMSIQSLQNARNDFGGDVFLCAQKDVNIAKHMVIVLIIQIAIHQR